MTNDDADGGVHDAVAANIRAAAVMAMQVGERLAKAWTELAHDAERRATTEAGLLAARIEAERATVVAALTLVERPDWWNRATVEEVAALVEAAATWQDRDPAAARAMTTIEREVLDRYGLTAGALQQRARAGEDRVAATETVVAADALDRAVASGRARADVAEDMQGLAAPPPLTDEKVERLQAGSEHREGGADRDAGEAFYDSAKRREAFAAELKGSAETDLIYGRLRADVNFAYPAEQATVVRGHGWVGRKLPEHSDRSRQQPTRSR